MTTTRALMVVAALAFADAGWAADTDVENPALRELPLQRGPIVGGHKHQPTPAEIQERAEERQQASSPAAAAPAPAPAPDAANFPALPHDDLYERVLRQSQRATPRAIIPDE
jgi:hypothetical protein